MMVVFTGTGLICWLGGINSGENTRAEDVFCEEVSDLKKYREVVGGSVFFLFSATYFVMAFGIKQYSDGFLSSDFIPKVYGIILIGLSICQIIISMQKSKKSQAAEDDSEAAPSLKQSLLSVTLTFVLLIGYVGLLKTVGFIIMSSVFIFLMTLMLYPKDQRTAKQLVWVSVIAVAFSTGVYLLFVKAFALTLPAGILG